MDVKSFHRRQSSRVVTIYEAVEEVESHSTPQAIVILSPESGDTASDSDVEDIPDSIRNEESISETAGEAEVDYCWSTESEVESSE